MRPFFHFGDNFFSSHSSGIKTRISLKGFPKFSLHFSSYVEEMTCATVLRCLLVNFIPFGDVSIAAWSVCLLVSPSISCSGPLFTVIHTNFAEWRGGLQKLKVLFEFLWYILSFNPVCYWKWWQIGFFVLLFPPIGDLVINYLAKSFWVRVNCGYSLKCSE